MRVLIGCGLLFAACGGPPAAVLNADGSMSYGGLQLSAPIVPESAAFAQFSDPSAYAKLSSADKTTLVTEHTHTFTDLLTTCAATDSTIVANPTTVVQRAANYGAVAKCAYTLYGPTPSWVPALIADVDVCGTKLSGGWTTPATTDLLLPEDYANALNALVATTGITTTEATFDNFRVYALTIGSTVETVDAGAVPPVLATIAVSMTLDTDPIAVRCENITD